MSEDNFEPLPIEEDTMTVPGRDQARYRQPGAEWSEWQDTHGEPALLTTFMQQKPPEFEWEWRRRKVTKAKSETERISAQDWVPVIDPNHILRARRDQVRTKENSQWSEWRHPPYGEGLTIAQYFTGPGEWECRTPRGSVSQQPQRPAPEQPPAPNPDRGSKYHRTITQTLLGETHSCSIVVDVYDVLQAFGVTCPALQHAVKKLLCAGLRGAKSATQDISEAANSCRRAIELLGADQ